MADVMPGIDKLPSINPDFDVNMLPEFDDEAPTATNLMKKKKKTKKKKTDKDKINKSSSKKSKNKKQTNTSNKSNSSNESKSKSKSKLKSKPNTKATPKQNSVKRRSSKKKKRKTARKPSSIRDRIKQYDTITKKARDEQQNSEMRRSKTKENTNKKNKKTKKTKKKSNKKKAVVVKIDQNTKNNTTTTTTTNQNINVAENETEPPTPTLVKQNGYTSNGLSISPKSSETDNVFITSIQCDETTNEEKQMFSETQFLASISPINSTNMDPTELFASNTMDTVKIYDSDESDTEPIAQLTEHKSAVDELIQNAPPAAYQMDLPTAPDVLVQEESFEAMYEPAYRHSAVKYSSLKSATSKLSDGDVMRDQIKQQIAEKEQVKANLKRKQSKTTTFDAKVKNSNCWGRNKHVFPTKNGQQAIIEWRFISTDNVPHTLVLQHEQIKKKKKSERMVILDGNENYSEKSKKNEFKINIAECSDVLDINIECKDCNAMKYNYRLKINNIAYSVVFHKWSKANK